MSNLEEKTVKELREIAKDMNIKGYSSMNKSELMSEIEKLTTTVIDTKGSETVVPEAIVAEESAHITTDTDNYAKYIKYLEYRDELRPVAKKEVNWKGQIKPRYECPLCAVKIGNPNDHFCYNCGARLREDEAYNNYKLQKKED